MVRPQPITCHDSTRDACCRVYGYNGQFDLGDENANNNLFWTLNGEIVYAKLPAFPFISRTAARSNHSQALALHAPNASCGRIDCRNRLQVLHCWRVRCHEHGGQAPALLHMPQRQRRVPCAPQEIHSGQRVNRRLAALSCRCE
jgi:hypothetical protein